DALARTGGGEFGILRQEAVAGVDRVGARGLGGVDDRLDRQVGADRVAHLADLVGLGRLQPMQRVAILVREDRDGPDAELIGRAEGADGDLATIGDQDFREHRPTVPGVIANAVREVPVRHLLHNYGWQRCEDLFTGPSHEGGFTPLPQACGAGANAERCSFRRLDPRAARAAADASAASRSRDRAPAATTACTSDSPRATTPHSSTSRIVHPLVLFRRTSARIGSRAMRNLPASLPFGPDGFRSARRRPYPPQMRVTAPMSK